MKSTTTSSPLRTDARKQETSGEILEQIRQRAYELYEQRGRHNGRDLDDWLHAEAEVNERSARRAVA